MLSLRRMVASASLVAPPQELEDFMEIGGVSPEGVAVPELGVTPLMNTDTELEDELPEDSPLFVIPARRGPVLRVFVSDSGASGFGVGKGPTLRVDPDVLEEPLEGLPTALISSLQVVADGPELDVFLTYLSLPAGSVYEPATFHVTPYLTGGCCLPPTAQSGYNGPIPLQGR